MAWSGGPRNRPYEFGEVVDMTGDAAFGLGELRGESAVYPRLRSTRSHVVAPREEAGERGEVQ